MLIHIPKYITKRGLSPKLKRQRKLIHQARQGSRTAQKKLEKYSCNVWTEDEVDACNYFLRVKDSLGPNGRMRHSGSVKLLRYLSDGPEEAQILWIRFIGEEYYLLCAEWPEGGLTLWVCTFHGAIFQPLCDVTQWSDINEEVCNENTCTRL